MGSRSLFGIVVLCLLLTACIGLQPRTPIRYRVHYGMTQQEVRAAVPESPDAINTTAAGRSVREQWVYLDWARGTTYLYFEDGLLVAWQTGT